MAEQDDAQQGEGKQEEHRASATDGLTSVRDAAVRAMGLQESLRGTLSLAESLQSTMGMAEAAERWQRQFDSLSAGDSLRRALDDIATAGPGRALLAERMASIGDSMAGFSQSTLATLAQEMSRASEAHLSSLARQIAALPTLDTSALQSAMSESRLARLHSFEAPEHLISPVPQRPAAPARPQPEPQPPAPQEQVHLLQQLEIALRVGTIGRGDLLSLLLGLTGKPKSRPGVQQAYSDEQYLALRVDYEQSGLSIDQFALWLRDERGIAIGASALKENWKRLGLTQGRRGRLL